MVKRNPVSAPQNEWYDAKQVDDTDLNLEQNYNNVIQSGIINNHFGSGILPDSLIKTPLFDSSLISGVLDGVPIYAQNQPTDNNYGSQLDICLTGSSAAGKRSVKVAVIGLDFESNLQYETFTFHINESQFSKKHFTKILTILINDINGNDLLSLNLGGTLIINEINQFNLSRDPIMLAQDVEPNLFFRDFFVDGYVSLKHLLQTALPYYNIDNLNIILSEKEFKELPALDLVSQVGQKFVATTNNIQKITLLLGVKNDVIGSESDLDWDGDIIISVYPLQSNISCPTDIAPNLEIEFPPTNIPLAQISVSRSALLNQGYILDNNPQPIDFVFSNTALGGGNALTIGNYYAFTIKRGVSTKCDILISSGNNHLTDSRVTTFGGTIWVDIPEDNLWFRIYTDAAKVSDGQAYDTGVGIALQKTAQDPLTLSTIDYCLDKLQFKGSNNFTAVLMAKTEKIDPVSDQRTGQQVFSKKVYSPSIELLNDTDISSLQVSSDPLLLGTIIDKNKKFLDSSTIEFNLYQSTMINDEILVYLDGYNDSLISNFLNGDFFNSIIYPNKNNTQFYRISSTTLCSMVVGDLDNNGIVDQNDSDLLESYIGFDLTKNISQDTIITPVGFPVTSVTYNNGHATYINPFTSATGISFYLVEKSTNLVLDYGFDGIITADPNDNRLARFTSASVSFNIILGVGDYELVMLDPSILSNYGGFDIIGLDTPSNAITIRKYYLNGNTLSQLLQADIDGDGIITNNDLNLITHYVDRDELIDYGYDKIGTRFNVLKIKLEKFVDRSDDFTVTPLTRSSIIHPKQNVFSDTSMYDYDFTTPMNVLVEKLLTWEDYLLVSDNDSKLVITTFPGIGSDNSCELESSKCNKYPIKSEFKSGKNDYYIPNNLVIDGNIINRDSSFYKVDFEVGTIILEVPVIQFTDEKNLNIFDNFVASYVDDEGNLSGVTSKGFEAMRFADCSYVDKFALNNNQVRFSVSVQSFSPNLNGTSFDLPDTDPGDHGPIVDGRIGVHIDQLTGTLFLKFNNLYEDELYKTLTTKIQINVFLKKAGFNNKYLFVDSNKLKNMLHG